jgi:hypothetical protein
VLAVDVGKTKITDLDELGAKRDATRLADRPIKRLVVNAWAGERPPVTPKEHRGLKLVCGCYGEVSSIIIRETPVADLYESVSERNALHPAFPSIERLKVFARAVEWFSITPVNHCGLFRFGGCDG